MHSEIKKITTSGMFCAVSLVFMLTGIIPGALFVSLFISICTLVIILDQYGTKYWLSAYIVTGVLGLILMPDLELSLTYVCIGWYPVVKKYLDVKPKLIRKLGKLIVYLVASYIIYRISLSVFGPDELASMIPFFGAIYAIIFSCIFWMLDVAINMWHNKLLVKLNAAIKARNKSKGLK